MDKIQNIKHRLIGKKKLSILKKKKTVKKSPFEFLEDQFHKKGKTPKGGKSFAFNNKFKIINFLDKD